MAVALKIPAVGESVSEVTISQWLKSDGDYVEMDEVVAELESEKATVELIAPEAGALKISVSEGSDVAVGSVVGEIDTSAKAPEGASPMEKSAEPKLPSAEPAKSTPKAETKPSTQNEKPIPSPSAAKLMRENNITSNQVKGSGKEGRITKGDVLNALEYVKQPGSRDSDRQKMSNL